MSYTPSFLKFYYLSLSEPINYVRNCYRDYVIAAMSRYPGHGKPRFNELYYDAIDYMDALIKELDAMDSRSLEVGRGASSTQILIERGFDPTVALEIAAVTFRTVLDTITQHLPQATFDQSGRWSYNFVNGCDLQVCLNQLADAPA